MPIARCIQAQQQNKLKGTVPPTFLYLMCLVLWVAGACLVWVAAGFLFLRTRTRALAKRMCFAMAGTFPFVFAYQAIAAPVVAVLLFFAWAFGKILEPGTSTMTQNPLVIGVSVGAVLISFVAVAAASVGGFYEGWRAGWLYGKGRALREVLFEGPTFRRIRRLRRKVAI